MKAIRKTASSRTAIPAARNPSARPPSRRSAADAARFAAPRGSCGSPAWYVAGAWRRGDVIVAADGSTSPPPASTHTPAGRPARRRTAPGLPPAPARPLRGQRLPVPVLAVQRLHGALEGVGRHVEIGVGAADLDGPDLDARRERRDRLSHLRLVCAVLLPEREEHARARRALIAALRGMGVGRGRGLAGGDRLRRAAAVHPDLAPLGQLALAALARVAPLAVPAVAALSVAAMAALPVPAAAAVAIPAMAAIALSPASLAAGRLLLARALPLLPLVLEALVLRLLRVRHLLDAVVREEVLERERDEPLAVLPVPELLRERDVRLEDRGAHRVLQLGDVPVGPDLARLLRRREQPLLEGDPELLLERGERVDVAAGDERQARALLADPAGPPDAVEEHRRILRQRVVDHVGEVGDVDAARRDVGRDHEAHLAALHLRHHPLALLLREVAVQELGVVAVPVQHRGDERGVRAGVAEHDRGVRLL